MVALALASAGCTDPREEAINQLLSFTAAAPFSIAAPTSSYSGYTIIVEDSALNWYNRIFRFFEPSDTTRSTLYQLLPAELFWGLPVTRVTHKSFRGIGDDTLLATVVYERPHRDIFMHRFDTELRAGDTLPPTDTQRATFRNTLRRTRNELQDTDTAFIWAAEGPRITRWRTASGIRDSQVQDSLALVARAHLQRLLAEARLRVLEFDDYSTLASESHVVVGGAIKGTVDPREIGWYRNERLYIQLIVQCEGRRGENTTSQISYLLLDDVGDHQEAEYLCLWSGEGGTQWARIRPSSVRLRLVAYLRTDSLFGRWIPVR